MSRKPALFLSLISFGIALTCCPSPAGADPIRVTSGFVDTEGAPPGEPLNGFGIVLSGAGLRIVSSLEDERAFVQMVTPPATVAAGALVDLSGIFHSDDPLGTLVNNTLGLLSAPLVMSFHASPAHLACANGLSLLRCTATAPFTFDAELTFNPAGGLPTLVHLVGGGTATGELDRSRGGDVAFLRYEFEAGPAPAPSTLWSMTRSGPMGCTGLWPRRRAAPPFGST